MDWILGINWWLVGFIASLAVIVWQGVKEFHVHRNGYAPKGMVLVPAPSVIASDIVPDLSAIQTAQATIKRLTDALHESVAANATHGKAMHDLLTKLQVASATPTPPVLTDMVKAAPPPKPLHAWERNKS